MNFNKRWLSRLLVATVLLVLLVSCEAIGYYGQAAHGQLSILLGREKIQNLLQDHSVCDDLKTRLGYILEIRQFAESELFLPVGDNYSTFVDLQRAHVVWNVYAAAEFSVDPLSWCYPIAGCVSYRGYFSERRALDYANKLQQQGFDVYTAGVDAYSTLGWFDDSVLSTSIYRDEHRLAALIFHELAHQLAYARGDTSFNEGFATFVEHEGLRRWLLTRQQEGFYDTVMREEEQQRQFVQLVTNFRDRLEENYAREISDAHKRRTKTDLQSEMREQYQLLKARWGGSSAYDRWFSASLNNAQLSTVSSYNDLVPAFKSLLEANKNDLRSFYKRVGELAQLNQSQRDDELGEFIN